MTTPLFSGKLAQILDIARYQTQKQAFVDGGMMAGGGDPAAGGGAPPMDPAAGGGAPPMDPAAGGGGAPPGGMDPSMGGAPPGPDLSMMITQAVQAAMAGQGGGMGAGGAGAGGALKPKIDVNVEIMQIKHMLAKIIDALQIPVSAQEMTATPEKLQQMAAQQGTPGAGGAGGAPQQSAIPPIDPMQGASPAMAAGGKTAARQGEAYDPGPMFQMSDRAAAMAQLLSRNGRH